MQIIIEGPDAVGKTTLANDLARLQDLKIMHLTAKDPNTYTFDRYLLDNVDNCVFDRFCLGESVYPVIRNRMARLSDKELLDCFEHVIEKKAILVVMYSSKVSILEDRLIKRGELIELETIAAQNYYFAGLAYVLRAYEYPGLITWNIAVEDYDDMLYRIIDLAVKLQKEK